MHRIKALIIDNDILVRRFFYNILNGLDEVEVEVLCSHDNLQSMLKEHNFDVVFLSLDEDERKAYTDINTLRSLHPALHVVATAKRTEEGAKSIIASLRNEVVDFITKPEGHNTMLLANRHFKKRLSAIIDNIKYLRSIEGKRDKEYHHRRFSRQRAKVVVIGTGAEGIRTLFTVFKKLPANLAAPILIVSHLPQTYTRVLSRMLNSISGLQVGEAVDGAQLIPGVVWIIPGGVHGEVVGDDTGSHIRLYRGQRENETRPSVDVIIRSVARLFRKSALGVFISGYGEDGFEGAKLLKEYGGQVILSNGHTKFGRKLLNDICDAGLCDQVCTEEYLSWEIMKRARLTREKPKEAAVISEGFPTVQQGIGYLNSE